MIDEARVTRDGDGLIDTVDGRPVRDYLHDRGLAHATDLNTRVQSGDITRAEIGPVSSVVMDRRTGEVYEGTNGRTGSSTDSPIPDDRVHPVLRQRLDEMRAGGPYETGTGANGQPIMNADPHPSQPLSHAEVRAANELLWRRGADAGPEALNDLLIDNTFLSGQRSMDGAPCCANCGSLLGGASVIPGRFTGFPPSEDRLVME